MKSKEHELQVACVKWFRLQYPEYAKLLFAVPNGGNRNIATASRLKAEGVVSGVSDLILLLSRNGYNSLCIEMKYGKQQLSNNQLHWGSLVIKYGTAYIVCRSLEGFQNEINKYLNTTK